MMGTYKGVKYLFSRIDCKSLDLMPELSFHIDNCSACCIFIKCVYDIC